MMDRTFPEPHPFDPDEDVHEPREERDPDETRDDALEREAEERRERFASQLRWLITCDRAAYEARHGTLDDPADRFRADAETDPF